MSKLNYSASDYKEFSDNIDSLFYDEGQGLIQKMGPYFSKSFAWSNTDYNNSPLGVDSSSLGIPFWEFPNECYVQERGAIEAIHEVFSFVRSHKVFKEFIGKKARYGISQMNEAIESNLKGYGFNNSHYLFDILKIRYFGIVAYCYWLYLDLGEDRKGLVFTRGDSLDASKSAKNLIAKIGKGLSLKSIEDTAHLEKLLSNVVDYCTEHESAMFLRGKNVRGAEESLRLAVISLGIFFTLSVGVRSPSTIRRLLNPIDESLTDKKVAAYLDEAKAYMIYHKVNKNRVLKAFVRDETLKSRVGPREAAKITVKEMQAFYEKNL